MTGKVNTILAAEDWVAGRGNGPTVPLLHGFPTWSYDYASVATNPAGDYEVITLDFLGYCASDKTKPYEYSVAESADSIEELLAHLSLPSVYLVIHDYGVIVGQELIDCQLKDKLPFRISGITVLNCRIVYSAYRPTLVQRVLKWPHVGRRL